MYSEKYQVGCIMSEISKDFWSKWLKASGLEKVDLVKTLTLPSQRVEPKNLYEHHCATLLNSYLVDAVDAEKSRIANLLHGKGQPWIDINISYPSADEIKKRLEECLNS